MIHTIRNMQTITSPNSTIIVAPPTLIATTVTINSSNKIIANNVNRIIFDHSFRKSISFLREKERGPESDLDLLQTI